jgi:glycosyltransferase-like protein
MNIGLLTYSTRPRGGVVHTLSLAEALAELGHTVTVYAVGAGPFFRPVRVPVRLAPLPEIPNETVGARVLRSITALRSVVDPCAHDLIHAQDCISANAVEPCIRTVHHLDTFTTPELAECHERAIVRPYAHICVSAAVATELADGWGIRATVIPNGVDYERFASARPVPPPGGPYMLSVGGIEPRKGTLDLLEALALLGGSGLRWLVAGGETLFDYHDYRATFERRATELGVRPTVMGPVGHEVLPGLVECVNRIRGMARVSRFRLWGEGSAARPAPNRLRIPRCSPSLCATTRPALP